jgi:hypothetical protein
MSFQQVDAGRGVEWLKQGFELVFTNPVVFLVNAFLFGLIWFIAYLIPLIGWILGAALAPILAAGMMYAFREQSRGGTGQIEHLFRGFSEPGKPVQLGLLGLPSIACTLLIVVLAFVFFGSAILGAAFSGGSNAGAAFAAGFGLSFLVVFLLGLAISLLAFFLIAFAVPRVMFDGAEPFAAMKESLSASIGNVGALLIFSVLLFGICLVGALVNIVPILGQLAFIALILVLTAVSWAGLYLAYRDLFGDGAPAVLEAPAPPPPPPA